MIYHVSPAGCDRASGHESAPLRTIGRAATLACAGDTVRVHAGVYREWVDPQNGGLSDICPITYEAAPGEHVILKGSEEVTGWTQVEGDVWQAVVPNALFTDGNPFAQPIAGDWLIWPDGNPDMDASGRTPYTFASTPAWMKARGNRPVHTGEVYLNGKALYEAASVEEVLHPVMRDLNQNNNPDFVLPSEDTLYLWYARVDAKTTTLWANFQGTDPNAACVEINVRPCCFYPRRTGVNYITLRGFEICQAACPFTPPTSDQIGMIGPHWSRGWIIENNHIHDAKCSAISLGRDGADGHNLYSRFGRKPGYQYQMEAVFLALRNGWQKGCVGGHIVRHNVIHDCGQNGVVGHMGAAFSRIEHNHIYRIAAKREFFGWEIAAIKLHAAVDTVIEGNNIHDAQLGVWLDWQAQGTRVTRNVLHHNYNDLMIEVSHGPCLVDNNIFSSPYNFTNAAQGTALVHNLFGGAFLRYPVLDRATPYHFPHTTAVAGCAVTYSGDDRVMNNLFLPHPESPCPSWHCGCAGYDGCTTPTEYRARLAAEGNTDEAKFYKVPQPVFISGNAYADPALPFRDEAGFLRLPQARQEIIRRGDTWYLHLTLPETPRPVAPVTTARLGMPRITEEPYENPDGTPVDFVPDLIGSSRTGDVIPGPLSRLLPGEQLLPVWKP